MYLKEELVAELGELARKNINMLVSVWRDVALGKDSRLFLRVAMCLLLISVVGGLTDIVSLCYICKFYLHAIIHEVWFRGIYLLVNLIICSIYLQPLFLFSLYQHSTRGLLSRLIDI